MVQYRERRGDDPEDLPPGDRGACRFWIRQIEGKIDTSYLPKVIPGDVILAVNMKVCNYGNEFRTLDIGARIRNRKYGKKFEIFG